MVCCKASHGEYELIIDPERADWPPAKLQVAFPPHRTFDQYTNNGLGILQE